ncbi:MAG: YeeE/YedE family protein [Bacteroidia bacterium]|nr:YeeE/YedE family protein [Bacteroidia bacterium]
MLSFIDASTVSLTDTTQPWPWYVAGTLIALTMGALLLLGRNFGVSSTLRTLCAIGGAGKVSSFFQFDWKGQMWNLVFVGGSIIGGLISHYFLGAADTVAISPETVSDLAELGISTENQGMVPQQLFSWEALSSWQGWVFVLGGGFLVGFGTRYAGGCTSGHAISGLANLQWPSLVAVVGFFIGGLVMTHLLFPLLLS